MPIKDPDDRRRRQREYAAKHYKNNKAKVIAGVKVVHAQNKKKWEAFKVTLSCVVCGFDHHAAMDFHHVDPATKTASVHVLVGNRRYAAAREEIKKCVVLCANCHRIHHHNERILGKTLNAPPLD